MEPLTVERRWREGHDVPRVVEHARPQCVLAGSGARARALDAELAQRIADA